MSSSSFALIYDGSVAQIAEAQFAVSPALTWVDVSAVSPPPRAGWSAVQTAGVWTFAAPAEPILTLAQQAMAALSAGLAVTSTGTPALNGAYAVDAATQSRIQAELIAILLNGTFADGTTSVAWPDVSGATHDFASVDGFKTFASAVSAYVAGLYKCINGTATALPAATATIP
jgi:hypothetical protein